MKPTKSTKPFKKLDCALTKTALLRLPPLALKIWLCHFAYEGKGCQSYPSIETLMKICRISDPHTVYKWREWLVNNNWLRMIGEIAPKHKGEFAIPVFSCAYNGTVSERIADGRKGNRVRTNRSRSSVIESLTVQCDSIAVEVEPIKQVEPVEVEGASERSQDGFFGESSDPDSLPTTQTTLNPNGKGTSILDIQEYRKPTISKTLTLPWDTEPSTFGSTRLPTLTGVRGDRRHSRLTFNSDRGLLNWLSLLDTRFDFRAPEDKIVTQLGADGKWAVDTFGIAHVSSANVLSTELHDGDTISADMTEGESKYRKLKPEFLPYLPSCGCGSRVYHMVRMTRDIGVLHTTTICEDSRCSFAIAQEVAAGAVEQKESLLRHYGGVSIPDPVALFNAHVPLGEKSGDANQVFGAKQPVVPTKWFVKGAGLVEGLTYQDAERSVQPQRDAYLDKKCLVGVV